MKREMNLIVFGALIALIVGGLPVHAQWVARDHRWPTRGPWMWALQRELPDLYREFNGIDFGHAHLAETLLRTRDKKEVEAARLEVLSFIFGSPPVPPDEDQIAPTVVRLVWEVQKTFHWAHSFHRSLYDLFAADHVADKEGAYRRILIDYLEKPEAITTHPLDLHGKLWSFPESKSFRDIYPRFNTQIWAYHWLQAAAYDVQLMGNSDTQRELMPRIIDHYHRYLHNPPLEWKMMPMMSRTAPEFSRRFPEAAVIFDNLHMLHDNLDDVLSRPDLYPDHQAIRNRILEILSVYLHRNHEPVDLHADYHAPMEHAHDGTDQGPLPPSAQEVLGIEKDRPNGKAGPDAKPQDRHGHK